MYSLIRNENKLIDISLDEKGINDVLKWSFDNCFIKDGIILYLAGEFLIAPGILYNKVSLKDSSTHDCILVTINDKWVWEYNNIIFDKITYNNNGQKSITLVKIYDNDIIKIIYSSKKKNNHKVKKIKNFLILDGKAKEIKKNEKHKQINH